MAVAIDLNWHVSTSTYYGSSAIYCHIGVGNTLYPRFSRRWGPEAEKVSDALSRVPEDVRSRVSVRTFEAGVALLELVSEEPDPQITVEETGELSFEWYKDRHHVAVLSVDGEYLRWAAMTGPASPVSGSELMADVMPAAALDALHAAI
jgi:hypothetical protein